MTDYADHLMQDLREIRDVAENAPERVSVDALDAIYTRMDALVTFLEAPEYQGVVRQLAERLRGKRPRDSEEIAAEFLGFLDGMSRGVRVIVMEGLEAWYQQEGGGSETVADQLADLPGLRPPYHGVNATAERIVDFIASQPDGRATGIEHWVLVKLQERAAIRRREEIAEVMRRVAVDHLYPALRDIGVEDPESVWELRGKWKP